MDSGATINCSSTTAAEEIQTQRLNHQEPGLPVISQSDRRFRFADGRVDEAQKVVEQPVTSGILAGISLEMQLIDRAGNDTCPLLSINDMRQLRMVVDYEDSKIMFKDEPTVWHTLPTTKKGLMMVPLTKEACERHRMDTPPPTTTVTRRRETGKDNAFAVCGCECQMCPGLLSGH